ncbi:aminotransferase class I/II-fold pyridoxal phosphate-dependent enzyme, partial [Streptomyces sp. L7]
RSVAEGVLGPDAALPPVRRLADELGVSPRHGRHRVQGVAAAGHRRHARAGRDRGGTGARGGVPPAAPGSGGAAGPGRRAPRPALPARVGAALAAVPGGARSHRSTPRLARLEEAVRDWLGRDGVPVEQVTFAHGALDLIGRLLSVELRPGDAVAMEDPGYHHLLDLVTALGLRSVPVAVDDEGLRPDALRVALRAGASAVVCSPRAQNPYGGSFSAARRDALVEVLRDEPEVLVVENDHAVRRGGRSPWSLASDGLARWVHVRTVSRIPRHRPAVGRGGLRSDHAWLGTTGGLLLTSGWVSHLLQETVHGLMTDDGTRALVTRAQEAYELRRETLREELSGRGITSHGASGMNLWVPVRDESAVVNGLRSYGWWVAAGARFRLSSGPGYGSPSPNSNRSTRYGWPRTSPLCSARASPRPPMEGDRPLQEGDQARLRARSS